MNYSIGKTLAVMAVWSVLTAVPALAQAPAAGGASGSNANDWTPANIIALIAALASAFVAVFGALRGTSAQSKADANEQRINSVSTRLDAHGQQITDLAMNMLPPTMQPVVHQQSYTAPASASSPPPQINLMLPSSQPPATPAVPGAQPLTYDQGVVQ